MKEGTWMVKKTKRITPSSQDKETAGSSGGVKRPHSHSSTQSQEKQQPKKPRSTQVQTGTYKEAVVGIKMAIVHRLHPDVNLDQKVYIVPPLTTKISCETTGGESSNI
jgi:hypothetical protein